MRGSFHTTLHADSVERCPQRPWRFVCATYQLVEEPGGARRRDGLVHLVDAERVVQGQPLQPLHTVATRGVLDCKWNRSGALLASVESEAGMHVLRVDHDDAVEPLRVAMALQLDHRKRTADADAGEGDMSLINLSLDWIDDERMALSHSNGSLSVWRLGEAASLINERWFPAHDGEAWIVAADACDAHGHQLWSGADDCALLGWDTRAAKPVFRKQCASGVTSLASHPLRSGLLAVGGYDERVHVYDARRMHAPVLRDATAPDALGGGVWRIKWHPQRADWLVLACMRGGFHTAHCGPDGQLRRAGHYQPHESEALAYGVDWLAQDNVACCSFYDSTCSVWGDAVLDA